MTGKNGKAKGSEEQNCLTESLALYRTIGVINRLVNSSKKCRYRNVRPHSPPAESHSFVGMAAARETAALLNCTNVTEIVGNKN